MPNDALVWVDHCSSHTCVYVDPGLFKAGRLTPAALAVIDEALGVRTPGLTLKSAAPCQRPLLHAVAG
ncbi:hypothetical protein AVW11_03770 [Streptomyces amritsarensis]|uniref:Uncharacterized protein n=1 Tax=Streptomyces amritsarensis TaxID=681158 RepID=A0ABX3GBS3_9ACTN|nr:hypothetical protein AVW11_03770 [Streptomyces amritsarensis]